MGIFSFLSKKRSQDDILASIFKVAEKGMYNLSFPITKEGRFEILMFDIWLAIFLTEDYKTNIDYMQRLKKVEEYLKQMASRLGLPPEKKSERIYTFRGDG